MVIFNLRYFFLVKIIVNSSHVHIIKPFIHSKRKKFSMLSSHYPIESTSDSSDEELDPNLGEYGDILEAFHIESDEEFDGFE